MNIRRLAFFDGYADPTSDAVVSTGIDQDNLDAPSPDSADMMAYWLKVDTIVEGADAMRTAGELYLPKFPNEDGPDYEFRRKNAKFTNIYRDVVENLASKPFEQEIKLADDDKSSQAIKDFIDDVDGAGSTISVWSVDYFFQGINKAIDWLFVDYTAATNATGKTRTVADEKAAGSRPYWTRVSANNMLEVQAQIIEGQRIITFVRMLEPKGADIFVRIIQRQIDGTVTWELFKKVPKTQQSKYNFIKIDGGVISIGKVPLVPFITGRKKGNRWCFNPPMRDAADLQVDLYQLETALKYSENMSAYVMIAMNGVKPDTIPGSIPPAPKPLSTGPMAVLWAPPNSDGTHGDIVLLEPAATSMTFLSGEVDKLTNQIRELGRNPLTAQSGNITVITAGVAAQKGNSAVQMWAYGLANALEEGLILTNLWQNGPADYDPDVNVFTDFATYDPNAQTIEMITSARDNGDLSQLTYWEEMQAHGVLSSNFDADKEKKRLADEAAEEAKQAALLAPSADDITASLTGAAPGNPPIDPATGLPKIVLPKNPLRKPVVPDVPKV